MVVFCGVICFGSFQLFDCVSDCVVFGQFVQCVGVDYVFFICEGDVCGCWVLFVECGVGVDWYVFFVDFDYWYCVCDGGGCVDDDFDWQVECVGEVQVVLVVCWDGYDGVVFVVGQYVVCSLYWQFFVVDWIDGVVFQEDIGFWVVCGLLVDV